MIDFDKDFRLSNSDDYIVKKDAGIISITSAYTSEKDDNIVEEEEK